MKQKVDCIVVGQGIAGTLLTWFLLKNKFTVAVVEDNASTCSKIAAGILHPVTGRRIVKSWMADTFIPFAENTYHELELLLNQRFYFRKKIHELLKETREYNDWNERSSDKSLSPYVKLEDVPYKDKLHSFPYSAAVQAGYLDIPVFLNSCRKYFDSHCYTLNEPFSVQSLELTDDGVRYQNISSSGIIFCDGYRGSVNPYWANLPWQLSKGEIMIIRCKDLKADDILNRKIFILPIGEDLYKVGSTYSWDSLNEVPTEEAKEKLISALNKILKVPFEVVDHSAGIRPTVKERRPFLGFHRRHKNIGIFNGLGTKGAMNAPWLANHLAEHMKSGAPLLAEVDVRRYEELLIN